MSEEAGEVAESFIGLSGSNPRKGFCATEQDVINELADVAITAMVAMHMFKRDPQQAIEGIGYRRYRSYHTLVISLPAQTFAGSMNTW